jgi:hypothetical protein
MYLTGRLVDYHPAAMLRVIGNWLFAMAVFRWCLGRQCLVIVGDQRPAHCVVVATARKPASGPIFLIVVLVFIAIGYLVLLI